MAELARPVPALISVGDLAKCLHHPDTKCLDATWVMPGQNPDDLPKGYIPGAQFFDIDEIADTQSSQKHMLPSVSQFERTMSDMGLGAQDHIICYDRHGIFSSPRLWWTLRMFGHENVSVLDGGLPAWIKAGQEVSDKPAKPVSRPAYISAAPLSGVINRQGVKAALGTTQILDARPSSRFHGTSPEPRANLRSGHMPGARSLPFGSLRTPDLHFKSLDEIKSLVEASGIDLTAPIITTCGSGITAAGLAFNLYRLGAKDIRLYDGSWSDWGDENLTQAEAPVQKTQLETS